MVKKRLLLSDQRQGEAVIEVAHEALLRQWELLSAWLQDERANLKEADALERQTRDWKESGEDESWLWSGQRLQDATALAMRSNFRKRLLLCTEFLARSQQNEKERQNEKLKAVEDIARLQQARADDSERAARKANKHFWLAVALATLALACTVVAVYFAGRATKALAEKQHQLERAQIEEGRAWVERAKLNLVSSNYFAAAMMAGRAIGYAGFGRELTTDTGQLTSMPQLLTPVGASNDEANAQELLYAALSPQDQQFGLQLWQSPLGDHQDGVLCVAFSPDGKMLASASDGGRVKLWEVGSGILLATFTNDMESVTSVAFSPDGETLASGSKDKTVKLWQVASRKLLVSLGGHSNWVTSVAFSPDGKTLASASEDGVIELRGMRSRTLLATFTNHTEGVTSLAFSPDGKILASGSKDATVKLWETASGKLLASSDVYGNWVTSVTFSPDGKMLEIGIGPVYGASADAVNSWSTTNWDAPPGFGTHTVTADALAFSPDGKIVASAEHSKVVLRVANSGTLLAALGGYNHNMESVAFSPDGQVVASGSRDGAVRLWAVGGPRFMATIRGHSNSVNCVAFSPDGKLLVSGSDDNTIKLWAADSAKLLATFRGHTNGVKCVAFSPNGKLLASGSAENTIRLWAVDTGKPLTSLHGAGAYLNCITFSPDGNALVSGGSGLELWDVRSGKMVSRCDYSGANSVAFSPDGKMVVFGSYDSSTRLWDMNDCTNLALFNGHFREVNAVAFSPNGKAVASGAGSRIGFSGDDRVMLWATNSENPFATFGRHGCGVSSVAFSPNGELIASASWDGSVDLWDVNSGRFLAAFDKHERGVNSVAFSPDGKTIASGSSDDTIMLWSGEFGRQWNLAAYLQSRVKLDGSELAWLNPGYKDFVERQLPILNVPKASLMDLYSQKLPELQCLTNCLNVLLRGQNWPAAIQVWREVTNNCPPPLPLRQNYVFNLATTAAEDVAKGVIWRGNLLTREVIAACTPQVFQDPAASLATLRLARELNSTTEPSLTSLRDEYFSHFRNVAPADWQEAIVSEPKTDESSQPPPNN
jgi:WD40 repeat protein